LSCLVLSCLVLSCLVLSCLVLPCLVLSCLCSLPLPLLLPSPLSLPLPLPCTDHIFTYEVSILFHVMCVHNSVALIAPANIDNIDRKTTKACAFVTKAEDDRYQKTERTSTPTKTKTDIQETRAPIPRPTERQKGTHRAARCRCCFTHHRGRKTEKRELAT
jgi:hypothetical protein